MQMSKVLSSILALLGSCALGQKPERIEMFKYLASPGPFFGPTWTVEKEVADRPGFFIPTLG